MTHPHGQVVDAATDGACSGNPGPGGWGVLYRFEDGTVKELGGYEASTTNNRMELKAALVLLEQVKDLPRHPELKIRTDSKYLIDGLSKWIFGWKRKGWRTSSGKQVLNQDLWQALDIARIDNVQFAYVKAHSGDPDNDRVDQIAVSFSKGTNPNLNSPNSHSHLRATVEQGQPAPLALNKIFSRLELADRFAQKGYSLSMSELSQLVDLPLPLLKQRDCAWSWRDWVVEPIDGDRWRLRRYVEDLSSCNENKDD